MRRVVAASSNLSCFTGLSNEVAIVNIEKAMANFSFLLY